MFESIVAQLQKTTALEFTAVFSGLLSVYFSRKEHILVYPVGLVSTIIYTYISLDAHLLGEASVNVYYSIMSVYGWYLWAKPAGSSRPRVEISYSQGSDWIKQILLALGSYALLYIALSYAQQNFYPGALPWADAFASATAYTGMYLMARKKVESWYWWMATNAASIPLYYSKGFAFTSLQFGILFIMAIAGARAWAAKARRQKQL